MDSNAGEFVGDERAQAWMQRIEVGEVVKIKGEELEVVSISLREITLKLLGQQDRDVHAMETALDGLASAESRRQMENILKHQK